MDIFPLNLVLAVAVASATIFLGFLPTRNIASSFFTREILKAAMAWLAVTLAAPPAIFHYYLLLALLCFCAWWQFLNDHAFNGKMWLSVASGLGISVGVMFFLAVMPRAYPSGQSPVINDLLLASIYLGGAVIGLAYVSRVLIRGSMIQHGITPETIRHYVRLLVVLTLARAVVLLALFSFQHIVPPQLVAVRHPSVHYLPPPIHIQIQTQVVLGLAGLVLPILALMAYRITLRHNQGRAATILGVIALLGFAAEMLARIFTI